MALITDELVEKVAKGLAERHWNTVGHGPPSDNLWRAYTPEARAALSIAAPEIASAERARCADIVGLARFGEIDTDFRTIIYFIKTGMSVEDIKKL